MSLPHLNNLYYTITASLEGKHETMIAFVSGEHPELRE